MLKRNPLLWFVPLAFALSWYPWVLAAIRGTGNGGPNPLGVLVAALVMTGLAYGKTGMKDFGARLVRWRVGLRWYGIVLLLPPAFCAASAGINIFFGAPVPAWESFLNWRELLDRFLFIFLFIGLGEEPGWRGFALPELQKQRTAARASAILACIWAVWHLPLMGTEFTLPIIPAFLISVVGATYVLTWISNNTRGSVLLAMIFHSTVNTLTGVLFPMFAGADMIRLWYIYALLWGILAAGLVGTGALSRTNNIPSGTNPVAEAA